MYGRPTVAVYCLLLSTACGQHEVSVRVTESASGDTTIVEVASAFFPSSKTVDSTTILWQSPELAQPTAIVRIGSVLVVSDRSQLHFVGLEGQGARTVGGAGEGPEEFGRIAKVGTVDGRVVALDSRNRRLSWWGPAGDFIETTPIGWSADYPNPAMDGNPLGVVGGFGYFVADQLIRPEGFTGSALLQLSLDKGDVRVAAEWEGREWRDYGQMMAPRAAFPAAPVIGVSPAGRYAWGDGFDPCVVADGSNENVLKVCRDRPMVPVTPGVARPDWSAVDLDPRFAEAIQTVVQEQEVGEFFPAYDQIRVDLKGGLWVRLLGQDAPDLHPNLVFYTVGFEPAARRWERYDAGGQPLGLVEMPSAFDPRVFLTDGAVGFLELGTGELVIARAWWAAS